MRLPSRAARGAIRVRGLGLRPSRTRVLGRVLASVCALALLGTLGAMSACTPAEAPKPAPSARPAQLAPLALEDTGALFLPDLMDLLVDPAAGVLLAATDPDADHEAEPRSAEAWQAIVDAAMQLVRAGDMLAQPPLSLGRSDWLRWAAAMREAAAEGGTAAGQRDAAGLAGAGARIRESCNACHALYAPQAGASPQRAALR